VIPPDCADRAAEADEGRLDRQLGAGDLAEVARAERVRPTIAIA
jgi:hypothetical protein